MDEDRRVRQKKTKRNRQRVRFHADLENKIYVNVRLEKKDEKKKTEKHKNKCPNLSGKKM